MLCRLMMNRWLKLFDLWRQWDLLLIHSEHLNNRFWILQIDHIVFITFVISCDLLIGSISPISIYSEFIHVFIWIKKLYKKMCWSIRSAHSLGKTLLSESKIFHHITRIHLVHFFALPIVKLPTYFNNFTSKLPFKYVFNFI